MADEVFDGVKAIIVDLLGVDEAKMGEIVHSCTIPGDDPNLHLADMNLDGRHILKSLKHPIPG